MSVNKAALDLITEFEGFVPNWYADPAHGWKVPTCCYGHTDMAGEPKYALTKGKTFTKSEGLEILQRDLRKYEGYVKEFITVPLNANQHGALTSWTFNLGPGNLEKSTLRKKLNNADYLGAADEILKWDKAAGKTMKGLTRRRAAERKLFLTPVSNVVLEPAPHLGPKPPEAPLEVKPVDVYTPDDEPIANKPSGLLWVFGAILLFVAVIFIVTQVRF